MAAPGQGCACSRLWELKSLPELACDSGDGPQGASLFMSKELHQVLSFALEVTIFSALSSHEFFKNFLLHQTCKKKDDRISKLGSSRADPNFQAGGCLVEEVIDSNKE